MRLPLMARISSSSRPSSSVPSSVTEPPTMRPGGVATSRMIDSAVTLLPQPDSPTTPSVSPRRAWEDTPPTALTTPAPPLCAPRRVCHPVAGLAHAGRGKKLRPQVVDLEHEGLGPRLGPRLGP